MKILTRTKVIVVKIGTKVLTQADGTLDTKRMDRIVSQLCLVSRKGARVVVVTSGAIGAGMGLLKMKTRPTVIPELQAAAAIGQSRLMQVYDRLFHKRKRIIAQVLLTADDLHHRRRYLNAKNTLMALLAKGVVPIINENDTVSVEEIKFGDNDALASLVAGLLEADALILLTDVKGLYDPAKRLVCHIPMITPEMKSWAQKAGDMRGTGGMISKLRAAEAITTSGIACVIADGRRDGILLDIVKGTKGEYTHFLPREKRLKARKTWIRFATKTAGRIIVDAGARDALRQSNRSLLASGITGVEGVFTGGSVVTITGPGGEDFAKGMANYSSEEIARIKGMKSAAVRELMKNNCYDEVVHRDNLVLL